MKEIIIKLANKEKINAEIGKVQSNRCTARTIDFDLIAYRCEAVEKHLKLSKKALDGVSFTFDDGQKFPNAYNYIPESTHFTAVYRNGAWRLTDVRRATCPNSSKDTHIRLTEVAKEKLLEQFMSF